MPGLHLVNADNLGVPAGHYSHAASAGGMLFLSGQLPISEHRPK